MVNRWYAVLQGMFWSLQQPISSWKRSAERFHSISAALGESRSRRHADIRTLSIKNSLELSWQWRIIVFRCRAQIGDSQALFLIWIVRWFALSIRRLSVRSNVDDTGSDTYLLDKFHHWYGHPQLFPKSQFTVLIGRTAS